MEYTTVDIVAMILIGLGPVALMVAITVFIYLHRDQWRKEQAMLQEATKEDSK